jgi:hypothetical protein
VALIIPGIITGIMAWMTTSVKPFFDALLQQLLNRRDSTLVTRRIEFETQSGGGGYYGGGQKMEDKNMRNNILQKALTLYIGEHTKGVEYKNANIALLAAKEKGARNEDTWEMSYGSTSDQLKMYSVCTVPPKDQWVVIEPGLMFMEGVDSSNPDGSEDGGNSNNGGNGDNAKSILTKTAVFNFSPAPDGGKLIDEYIKRAYNWYIAQVDATLDNCRYMYMITHKEEFSKSADDGSSNERSFKRYKLSDRKTFDSLFFPEKDGLLHLFDNFLKKKGKYAIPGYPDKLGLLLHGPPGTGKTSLIKAMASYTKRSIVNISLSKIKTNQELMDIFFDQKFAVKDEEMPVRMSFSDVIFVMEDVDAASKIVHKRSSTKKAKPISTTTTSTTSTVVEDEAVEDSSTADANIVAAVSSDDLSLVSAATVVPTIKRGVSSSHKEKKVVETKVVTEKTDPIARTETGKSNHGVEDDNEDDDEEGDDILATIAKALSGGMGGTSGSGGSDGGDDLDKLGFGPTKMLSKSDKLDLSGLLNVLDGVVDTRE